MPSLRKRVSSYFRQLSFHNEPSNNAASSSSNHNDGGRPHHRHHRKHHNVNENSFVTAYLQGKVRLNEDGEPVVYGKNPTDLPNYQIDRYQVGGESIIGCYTGPNGGLTTVKRVEKHLSVLDPDIDFIDTAAASKDDHPDIATDDVVDDNNASAGNVTDRKSPNYKNTLIMKPVDNATMMIKVAGQEYCVTNRMKQKSSNSNNHNKSHSCGSLNDCINIIEIEKTKIDKEFYNNNIVDTTTTTITDDNKINNETTTLSTDECIIIDNSDKNNVVDDKKVVETKTSNLLAKSKSEGNPFQHKKRQGKIIRISQRPKTATQRVGNNEMINAAAGGNTADIESNLSAMQRTNDSYLSSEWNRKSDRIYGLSDSLYDRNQITMNKNGDPIADCFGIITRGDSAIVAVADGVNWGEKASIAAKSAVHGCLHYLNKTIFNDTTPFDQLTDQQQQNSDISSCNGGSTAATTTSLLKSGHLINNTRDVFVCLLRAFNCAHDLILANQGMLTTLTVVVVLPLKSTTVGDTDNNDTKKRYVCCVCNVGDTLAYVYSPKKADNANDTTSLLIRELTKGSHDIYCNRDMRDALGALGPVDGINPELSNLTLSLTVLDKDDIIMVASDGLTDNFDPNVCRFTVPTGGATPKTTSTGNNNVRGSSRRGGSGVDSTVKPTAPIKPPRRVHTTNRDDELSVVKQPSVVGTTAADDKSPLIAQFVKDNSIVVAVPDNNNKASNLRKKSNTTTPPSSTSHNNSNKNMSGKSSANNDSSNGNKITKNSPRKNTSTTTTTTNSNNKYNNGTTGATRGAYKFLRSKTTVDVLRRGGHNNNKELIMVLRDDDGLPYVTPLQRYELQLLMIGDVLSHGISGRDGVCRTARTLCENLLSYTLSITSAKRHTLEDPDLYFDNRNGLLVEVSQQEKKLRRKKGLERVQNLPGKLDHVTVVAWNVGGSDDGNVVML